MKTATMFLGEARAVCTPLVAISTLDQFATAQAVLPAIKDGAAVSHDVLRGLVALNDAGTGAVATMAPDQDAASPLADPGQALAAAQRMPAGGCLFIFNAHRFLTAAEVVQGLMNLRDRYKRDRRTVVLLGPAFELPAELAQDVALFEEPLPTTDAYASIVGALVVAANASAKAKGREPVASPDAEAMRRLVTAVRGLAAFPAEQALVLSLTPDGFDEPVLWGHKKHTVESTQGLRFSFASGVQLQDVIGLNAIAQWTERIGRGPCRPGAILFLDEIEKMVAGGHGDTSGVSQALVGKFLTWTAERRHKGILMVGPPGVGKSYVAEAMANSLGVPLLAANVGDVKGSLVGESERNMATLLRVVDSVAGDNLLMVATCNREEALSPELRDRFNVGTWFVDLPSPEAQAQMWAWYTARPEYQGYAFGEPPAEVHYSGRDVANIVASAWAQQVTLREAARTSNVPVALSQPKVIEALRERAHGVYLSAHRPGPYHRPDSDEARREQLGGRLVTLGDES